MTTVAATMKPSATRMANMIGVFPPPSGRDWGGAHLRVGEAPTFGFHVLVVGAALQLGPVLRPHDSWGAWLRGRPHWYAF
ncbi:hypothetical protein [Propionibacterium sp. oral taxon 192]|uniref:hypothetical protein n=1 Tax=Propionibacterium sp. oral taxon 192 TaxID=671222 RepID=UPI000559D057|nr:hypothetical protein [Propionibacterium sp. oral taxon 192]